jgi:hypothetical protein
VIEGAPSRAVSPTQTSLLEMAPARERSRGQRGPNRNTKETRDWILRRFDNPLEGMCALALPADVIQIAEKARALSKVFRCSVKEAVELMLKASVAANPFLNSAMPQDLNINTKSVALIIGMDASEPGTGLGALRAEMLARAGSATPAGAQLLESVAHDLGEADAANSTA